MCYYCLIVILSLKNPSRSTFSTIYYLFFRLRKLFLFLKYNDDDLVQLIPPCLSSEIRAVLRPLRPCGLSFAVSLILNPTVVGSGLFKLMPRLCSDSHCGDCNTMLQYIFSIINILQIFISSEIKIPFEINRTNLKHISYQSL